MRRGPAHDPARFSKGLHLRARFRVLDVLDWSIGPVDRSRARIRGAQPTRLPARCRALHEARGQLEPAPLEAGPFQDYRDGILAARDIRFRNTFEAESSAGIVDRVVEMAGEAGLLAESAGQARKRTVLKRGDEQRRRQNCGERAQHEYRAHRREYNNDRS